MNLYEIPQVKDKFENIHRRHFDQNTTINFSDIIEIILDSKVLPKVSKIQAIFSRGVLMHEWENLAICGDSPQKCRLNS